MTWQAVENAVIVVVRDHQGWAPPIVFALAFGESLAFLSLVIPATVILLGVGALIAVTDLEFWPLWLAAALGAFFGDWFSFYVGQKLQWRATRIWPLTRHPELFAKGQRFIQRWGLWSVFIGRFFGPLRAIVPLIAGIYQMAVIPFMIGNAASALIWSGAMLAPGAFGIKWIGRLLH